MPKKSVFMLSIIFCICLCLCGCTNKAIIEEPLVDVYSEEEALLFEDVHKNNNVQAYVGNTVTKRGIYTQIKDTFALTTRSFIWGYTDETKASTWHWEFVSDEIEDMMIRQGSIIEITGIFCENATAMDGFQIEDVSIKAIKKYEHTTQTYVDMSTMSPILQRIQMANIKYYPNTYDHKTICLYGVILGNKTICDPIEEGNGWDLSFIVPDDINLTLPENGTAVVVKGTMADGVLTVRQMDVVS